MTKLTSQISALENAISRLEEALNTQKTDLIRDATIQRFEFTFELSLKTISTFLKENGITPYGMGSIIREAYKTNLILDTSIWLKYLEARNLTSHTYDLIIAEKVYQVAQEFPQAAKKCSLNSRVKSKSNIYL
ncbi:MAG: nucleotidyltransferase [Patescibacteria group bacterium]|nr:MAG: nucleotidyltransferase [Patescibacteria group bacterium]